MAILEILHYPDNRLRQKCENVEDFDESLELTVSNMLETMYDAKGIGLAAIQVNIIKRIIVIDVSEKRDNPIVLINTEIISKKEKIKFEEGCLSVPGFYEQVERYNIIEYVAKGIDGKEYRNKCEGLMAGCVQHEIDHLNGVLFVDRVTTQDDLKRELKEHGFRNEDVHALK